MWHLFINILHPCTHELPTKHPREKILHLQKTHETKIWTYKTLTIKNVGPTKYPREKISDPRNTHEKKFRNSLGTMIDGTKPMRPTMARDPQNLAH